MIVVLDANVYISALMNPDSNAGVILRRWQKGEYTLCVSEESLAEIRRVLTYPKVRRFIKQTEEQVVEFLDRLHSEAQYFERVSQIRRISDDPDDDHYLALSADCGADFLVSGDNHLLRLRSYRKTWIVSPAAMLAFLSAPSASE